MVERDPCLCFGEFGSVHGIVPEVFFLEAMFFEPIESVGRDPIGIEPDLNLDVFGRWSEGTSELLGESAIGVIRTIEEVVAAVPFPSEGFEDDIIEAICADAGGIEGDAFSTEGFDGLGQSIRIGIAEIGRAVREEDDAILGSFLEVLLGLLLSQGQGGLEVGASFTRNLADEVWKTLLGLFPGEELFQEAWAAGEGDEGESIVHGEEVRQAGNGEGKRFPAVRPLHGPGNIEEEGETERGSAASAEGAGAEGHAEEIALGEKGVDGLFMGKGHGLVGPGRGVAVVKGIDEFLWADARRVRPFSAS